MSDRSLWKHADFLRLWAAQAISAIGSRITRTALPIIAVKTLGQPDAIMGVLGALQLLPGVVLAMVAGGWVDRGAKRRILIGADIARGLLVASLTLAWALGALSMLHVAVVGALVGAATALFQITDVAYLPSLIGKRRLADGNAKLQTTEAIAEIAGPASAGALIAALGAPLAVVLDAASYLWSAIMLGRIRAREKHHPRAVAVSAPDTAARSREPDTGVVGRSPRAGGDFRIGMRAIFGHALVRPIVLALMTWSITGGFFTALYTPFCLREIGLSESTFGAVIAMGGVGALGGALVSRALVKSLGVGRTLVATSSLSLAFGVFIPLADGVAAHHSHGLAIAFLVAHQLMGDAFSVAFVVVAVTLRQTVLPKELLGRANAAIHVCTIGMLPIASLAAGALASIAGIRFATWFGVLVGMGAPIFLWPLRRLRDMPSPDLSASDSALSTPH